jgi:ring-1,2-phenylacetyl-CoA epoxidase subunit PaaE
LTPDSVKISFSIPSTLQSHFNFVPGQFINLILPINKNEERRSYSICSSSEEDLAIAVKSLPTGLASVWLNEQLSEGDQIQVSAPEGNFKIDSSAKNIVAFAAGSGITPIFSMAKHIEKHGGELHLFYGSKDEENIIFYEELAQLNNTKTTHYLSRQEHVEHQQGRLTKERISSIIKENLSLLKADGFYLCGPEELIVSAKEVLTLFGVPKEKIHFELYTTPVLMQAETTVNDADFDGISEVTVMLDDEKIAFKLDSAGKTILDTVNDLGYDAPYSCRGGVCCTCKAKVLEGKVTMTLNYSLSDQEVKDGYVLTCQAHPASEKVKLTYDE